MTTFAALMFVVGIVLAGADGPWFPWINLIGMILVPLSFALISYVQGELACPPTDE